MYSIRGIRFSLRGLGITGARFGVNWHKRLPDKSNFSTKWNAIEWCSSNTDRRYRISRHWVRVGLAVASLCWTINLAAPTCEGQVQVWLDSLNSPVEGDNLTATVHRDGAVSQGGNFTVRVELTYTDPITGFDVFRQSLPHVLTASLQSGNLTQSADIAINTLDNQIVNNDVTVKAEVISGTGGSSYCMPDTTSRPSSKTTTIRDDDSYTEFLELATKRQLDDHRRRRHSTDRRTVRR